VLDQIWTALSFPASQQGGEWIHILLSVLWSPGGLVDSTRASSGGGAFPPIGPGKETILLRDDYSDVLSKEQIGFRKRRFLPEQVAEPGTAETDSDLVSMVGPMVK
jgi:hypothetical protein